MRFATAVGLLLVSGSLVALAQQPAGPARAQTPVVHVAPELACPVAMDVRQGVDGKMVATGKDAGPAGKSAARLKLILNHRTAGSGNSPIVKARVRVRGLGGNPTVVPAESDSDRSGNLAMAVTIGMGRENGSGFSGDIVLPGFTAALTVDLLSVTMEDGAVHRFAAGACRAVPDPLMPVDGE